MGRMTEIDMRRRRLRRLKKMSNSSITYTKDEPYAICFYLYNIFEEKKREKVKFKIQFFRKIETRGSLN